MRGFHPFPWNLASPDRTMSDAASAIESAYHFMCPRYRRRVSGAISLPFQTHPSNRMITRSESACQEGATDGECDYDGNPAAAPTEARRYRAESADQENSHVYGPVELHDPICLWDRRFDGH